MNISIDLYEQLVKGNVVLFYGMDLSALEGKLPTASQLKQELIDLAQIPDVNNASLAEVAQIYGVLMGLHNLRQYLKQRIDQPSLQPLAIHRHIAQLPIKQFVTTSWDTLLEKAYNIPVHVVVEEADTAYQADITIIKLYGSLPAKATITSDEQLDLFRKQPEKINLVRSYLATKTILFLGYDLNSQDFKRLYHDVTQSLGDHKRRAYAVQFDPPQYTIDYWQSKNLQIISTTPLTLLEELQTKLAGKTETHQQTQTLVLPTKVKQKPAPFVNKRLVKFKLQLGRLFDLEFETRVTISPMGEPVGYGKLPYTQEQLVAVLKTLQASQYQEQNFTPTQRDVLKQLGLLTHPHFLPNLQQRIGEMLFQGLLADQNVRTAFQIATTQARANNETVSFQLRFDEGATELARYPWELLHDSRRALLPSGVIELTRYISYPEATTPLSATAPLRLLYITARPNDLPELSPDTEKQTTQESLQPLAKDGKLHIDDLPHATYNALLDYLDDYKPHILHFDGHGRFHRQCHVCHTFYYPHITQCETCSVTLPNPQGYLAFEKEDGAVDWISSEILGHLFNSSLRLAVLSACHSGTVRGDSLFGGVGPALIQAGVPAVVATQLPISVNAAQEFAKGLYRALARYESLATAVNAGRRRLFNTKEWFIPVLYLRSQDDEGHLFTQP